MGSWLKRGLAAVGLGKGHEEPQDKLVLTLPDGRKLTQADLVGLAGQMNVKDGRLVGVTGSVRYEIIGAGNVPSKAHELHEQGRIAGGRAEYTKAIGYFEEAARLAPEWPYPVYDRAFTHLLMGDAEGARTYYAKTVELAPRGFFTAITALDSLEKEKAGELPIGTYLKLLSLEWTHGEEREKLVRELVEQVPQFAPGWKEFAGMCESDDERLRAIEQGLQAKPDRGTREMLLINKALAMNIKGERNAALQLLGELALDPKSTLSTEQSAKAAISILTGK